MKKSHVFAAIAALAVGAWMLSWSEPSEAKHLLDRPWVSNLPEDPREAFHVLFLSKKHERGVAIVGSQYQHLVNALGYELKGDKLNLNFLQQEFKMSGKVKTWKCKAPGDLDLCLEINYRLKKVRLYSSTKWRHGQGALKGFDFDLDELEDMPADCPTCKAGEPHWLTGL